MKQILVFWAVFILQVTGLPNGFTQLSDVNSCLFSLHQQMGNMLTTTLGGIVNVGWDDLCNKMTLPIFATTFSECKTTPDGHFLIPDNVLAVPIQEVFIDRSARSYKSYNDVEKENIKADRHEINGFVGGGTFAKGNQETKKFFSNGNTMMLESQFGYKAFTFISQEKELDLVFRGKIDEIIESLNRSLPTLAKYQAECIIRDYGTHVVNKALTGASMKYKAFVKAQGSHSHDAQTSKIEAEAAATFLKIVGGGDKSTSERNLQTKSGFEEQVQFSTIETKGGSDVRKVLNDKEAGSVTRMDNIVGLEHEGTPIYSIIHKNHFPDHKYETSILVTVKQLIFNATKEYYEVNTVSGCTIPTAKNFDPQANFDDGTCDSTKTEYLFGGVFLTCNETSTNTLVSHAPFEKPFEIPSISHNDLTKRFTFNHPITQKTACPEGYDEILLINKGTD